MTVADLRDRMSNDEFMLWNMYYQRISQRQEMAQKLAEARNSG